MQLKEARDTALALIKNHMRLRAPQEEAIDVFQSIISALPVPLHEASMPTLRTVCEELFPAWRFRENEEACPEITVNIATGVGKTKLIGAIIAYLFNANESQNFLILTPRARL